MHQAERFQRSLAPARATEQGFRSPAQFASTQLSGGCMFRDGNLWTDARLREHTLSARHVFGKRRPELPSGSRCLRLQLEKRIGYRLGGALTETATRAVLSHSRRQPNPL